MSRFFIFVAMAIFGLALSLTTLVLVGLNGFAAFPPGSTHANLLGLVLLLGVTLAVIGIYEAIEYSGRKPA
jgi:hypothetical protein